MMKDFAERVSIVVPIYHGKQYIGRMIRQVEACAEAADPAMKVELLLVNDDPAVPIQPDLYSEKIEIRVLSTGQNCGIHGARVYGLRQSRGDYVVFLDQDDLILPLYLKSQRDKIGNADAAVCRLVDGGRVYYNEQRLFQDAVDWNCVIGRGNTIVSPGQALIRKKSIPDVWQRSILKHNGADDWLLWICMLRERRQFLLNDDILFEHIMEGDNSSLHTEEMIRSEREIIEIVRKNGLLSDGEMLLLQQTFWEGIYGKMQLLDKFRKITALYGEWMKLEKKGRRLSTVIAARGAHTAAVYGNGIVGKQIEASLKETDVSVCYFIDRNKPYLGEALPVYGVSEALPDVDMVIISLVEHEEDVRELLCRKLKSEIWTITELIDDMCDNG